MSAYSDYAFAFLKGLYLETEDSGRDYFTATEIHDRYGLQPKDHWIGRMADDWEHSYFKDVSRILGGYDGWSFRISAEGARLVEAHIEASENSSPVVDRSPEPIVAQAEATEALDGPDPIQSESWTGPRYILTDAKIIQDVRLGAKELRDRVYATRFESNSDSQDLKSLSDALVAICDMAEPDLSIIERILAHPKFTLSAALIAAIATIRGALGI